MHTSPNEFIRNIFKVHSEEENSGIISLQGKNWDEVIEIILQHFTWKTESINKQLSLINQMDETIQEINRLSNQIWRMQKHGS